jgi:S-adenosylmethionine:diacylglycerol 3-amino-3-carboxypropyl transferase
MTILFTRAWEDDRLDLELLLSPGQEVLVVAAAGDAALALAAGGSRVTAVDTNPDQLALVSLKLAAAEVLDDATLHRWFEVGSDPAAPSLYRALVRPLLPASTALFWDARIGAVVGGFHTHSGVGRPFARLGRLARLICPGLTTLIETVPDPTAQSAAWRSHVAPRLFGTLTHAAMRHTRLLAPLAPNRAELDRMRTGGWSHGLVERIDGVVATGLIRRHPWWRPVFAGRPADPGEGAAWLDKGRGRLELTLIEADLAAALTSRRPASLAAASLSNVPDWLDSRGIESLAAAASVALRPGGRLLVRRVVRPAEDAFVLAGLIRDPVSDSLVARERTALYEAVDLYRKPDTGSAPRPG